MLRSFVALAIVLSISALAAGCGGDSGTSPSAASTPTATYSQTDLVVGTGAEVTLGRTVVAHYSGWFYDPARPDQKGTLFETSVGRQPITITIATGQVIGGWVRGVVGMKVGGQRRLVLPPELAYGSTGTSGIPPNSSLVFDIELLAVQ